jgi:hypothetical protein
VFACKSGGCSRCIDFFYTRYTVWRYRDGFIQAGKGPIEAAVNERYLATMNLLLLILVLVLLFGGGGFYFGGPMIGGGGLGLVLLIALIIYMMGGWRTKS